MRIRLNPVKGHLTRPLNTVIAMQKLFQNSSFKIVPLPEVIISYSIRINDPLQYCQCSANFMHQIETLVHDINITYYFLNLYKL